MITLYLADICLGLFIGTLAQSAIAPAPQARKVFTASWYVGGLFIALAWVDSQSRGLVNKYQINESVGNGSLPSVDTLVFLVIIGIIAGLILSKMWVNQILPLSPSPVPSAIKQPTTNTVTPDVVKPDVVVVPKESTIEPPKTSSKPNQTKKPANQNKKQGRK